MRRAGGRDRGEVLDASAYVASVPDVGGHDGPTQGVGDDGVGGFVSASLCDGDVFAEFALVPEWLQSFDGDLDGLTLVLVDLCSALQVARGDNSQTNTQRY